MFVTELEVELQRRYTQSDYLTEILRHALLPAGQLLRPLLVIHSNLVAGGEFKKAMPAALACEFLHVASIMHDDLIDGDTHRRGRQSTQAKFGMESAVIGGDALIVAGFRSLAECRQRGVPAERVLEAMDLIGQAGASLCVGGVAELTNSPSDARDLSTYWRTADAKTGALCRSACSIGAVIAGAGEYDWQPGGHRYTHRCGLSDPQRHLALHNGGVGRPAPSSQ